MSKTIVFVQHDGSEGLVEAALAADITHDQLYKELAKLGVEIEEATLVFVDEAEEPLKRKGREPVPGLTAGCRLHVSHCRKINVTVHYLERTIEDKFAPGTRVRRVKQWAIKSLELDRQDAAEHLLQICDSTERPASDTPLPRLTDGKRCAVCFDLVPDKRVEG